MTKEVSQRLESGRKELLDLSMRNPLLNQRKRAKQVEVSDELSNEIYRILVTQGKEMSFEALPESKLAQIVETNENEENQKNHDEDINSTDLLAQPEESLAEGMLASRHTDRKLQTILSSEKLQTRVLSIHNDAKTYIEEQGVNILYLALGFLYWYESDSVKEPRRAPLILVPVELKRISAQDRFFLLYTGEEIGDNLSLIEKLKTEFSVNLPEIGDTDDLNPNSYFSEVCKVINANSRWKVEANEITLGFFSFGKFLMYKDLDANAWSKETAPCDHKILSTLLDDGFREADSSYDEGTHIDEIVSPSEVHLIKDADSTQMLAILDVNAGRNMVIQGPPGTGKSQTITNIIAECIGNGKKVLFVSEKMAALEVVKRRLDDVGLGDAVLELHSHKTNKKKVLEELNRTLHQKQPLVKNTKDDIEALTQLRDKLNTYCNAVNKPIGNTKISFVKALGGALQITEGMQTTSLFNFAPMVEWPESNYKNARMLVEELDRYLEEAGPPARNCFKDSRLDESLPSQRQYIENILKEAYTLTKELIGKTTVLAESVKLKIPENIQELDMLIRTSKRIIESPFLDGIKIDSGKWKEHKDEIVQLIDAGCRLKELHKLYDEYLIDDAWEQDLSEVLQNYIKRGKKWWSFLSGNFRRSKARLQRLSRKQLPKNSTKIIEIIEAVLESQKFCKIYSNYESLGKTLFGIQWKGKESDWDTLEKLFKWIVALYQDIDNNVIPTIIINVIYEPNLAIRLKEQLSNVEPLIQKHNEALFAVSVNLKLQNEDTDKSYWDISMNSMKCFFEEWQSRFDDLYNIVRYNQISNNMKDHGLSFIIEVTKEWDKGRGSLVRAFDYCWYNGLVEKAYSENPSIKLFDRVQHEHILNNFSRLDHLLFEYNKARLMLSHWETLPSLSGGGQLQIISREIHKKRRHMPIRELVNQAGQAIQAIKPVFMMSPMSIAMYIPPSVLEFDLVIFDEASQVKPVDAFGAILRSKQAVIVGDDKQLPPTSFFNSLQNSDDEEDFDNLGDMESILSLFLAKGAPERMLRWHYRSRHESLIAVSNNEFYDNRLVVFPSPGINSNARGLRLRHFPKTAYDRGKTCTNQEEAQIVAQAVLEHAKTYPDHSLGVVAFSVAQRDIIELQLERLRRINSKCESFFNENKTEPFFIKNLENVQGDERDVIFVSIGYGKTAEGYMTMSFGPLNREGGERRLNVLISRARLAMDVFSNFIASDIDLNRSNARGVVSLKKFLNYAETGNLDQPYLTDKEPDSIFEETVIKALIQRGIAVEPQVGTAGFFIDIGVKDPGNPGRFILGIECDGATYHSSRSARDRDRLRQEVLEGLGWKLYRIWSTDWYRNPKSELERVVIAIKQAREQSQKTLETHKISRDVRIHVERGEISRQKEIIDQKSIPYTITKLNVILSEKELHELSPEYLLDYVKEVVEKESPVHKDEVIRRITEGAGLRKAGKRIQQVVNKSIHFGIQQQCIIERQNFLWSPDMEIPQVRNRTYLENASKKIEWVAPEEVSQAILTSVETSFSLHTDEAIQNAAKMLGFQRVTENSKTIFNKQISLLLEQGWLLENNRVLSIGKNI